MILVPGFAEFQYLYFSQFFYAVLSITFNFFQWILMIFGVYVIWVKIFDGIEYEHDISLNMRMMADHVTLAFLASLKSIFQLEPSNLVC